MSAAVAVAGRFTGVLDVLTYKRLALRYFCFFSIT